IMGTPKKKSRKNGAGPVDGRALRRAGLQNGRLLYQRPCGCFFPRARALERGDHAGDGVVEGGFVVEIGLPEAGEKLEVVFPTAFVKAFADGVRNVSFFAARRRTIEVGLDGVLFVLWVVVRRR